MPASANSPTSAESSAVRPSQVIYGRVCEIMISLLDGIERDIAAGTLPSPHMAAYDAMVRAEHVRTA